jgi:hypothetical protein
MGGNASGIKLPYQPLAEEDGGLGIVVKARYFFISSTAIEGDGGGHISTAVKIDPVKAGAVGMGLGRVHELAGKALAAELRRDVEALALRGGRNGRKRTEKDAACGSAVDFCEEEAELGVRKVGGGFFFGVAQPDVVLGVVELEQSEDGGKVGGRGAANDDVRRR